MAKERPKTPSGMVPSMWWWMLARTSMSLPMRLWKLCHSSVISPFWLGASCKLAVTCMCQAFRELATTQLPKLPSTLNPNPKS